jgi:hypothetical protein
LYGPQAQLAADFQQAGTGLNKPPESIKPPLNPLNTLASLGCKLGKHAGFAKVFMASAKPLLNMRIKGKKVLKA